ncbi:MAG: hypothetical protein PHO31_01290 [Candidatus Pacebacteria bacterium]|nr:hypothetical protein [Candidatus Paceibacterota bacterium]
MIFGHKKNILFLSQKIKEGNLAHSYFFEGISQIGKKKVAIELAKYLEGDHNLSFFDFTQKQECLCKICNQIDKSIFPDVEVVTVQEQKSEIGIKNIKEIERKSSLATPFPFKIFIFDESQNFSHQAISALLKTIEEPRKKSFFIFVGQNSAFLPQTILSRLQVLRFTPLSKNEIIDFLEYNNIKNYNKKIIDLSMGRPGLVFNLALDNSFKKYYNIIVRFLINFNKTPIYKRLEFIETLNKVELLNDFLDLGVIWFRDLLILKETGNYINLKSFQDTLETQMKEIDIEDIKKIINNFEEVKRTITFYNVNARLLVENLVLGL